MRHPCASGIFLRLPDWMALVRVPAGVLSCAYRHAWSIPHALWWSRWSCSEWLTAVVVPPPPYCGWHQGSCKPCAFAAVHACTTPILSRCRLFHRPYPTTSSPWMLPCVSFIFTCVHDLDGDRGSTWTCLHSILGSSTPLSCHRLLPTTDRTWRIQTPWNIPYTIPRATLPSLRPRRRSSSSRAWTHPPLSEGRDMLRLLLRISLSLPSTPRTHHGRLERPRGHVRPCTRGSSLSLPLSFPKDIEERGARSRSTSPDVEGERRRYRSTVRGLEGKGTRSRCQGRDIDGEGGKVSMGVW